MEKLIRLGAHGVQMLGIPMPESMIQRLSHMSRVGIVGLMCLFVQTTLFEILGIQLEIVQASTAALIGGEVAVLLGFTLNNHFNFRDRNTDPLWRRLAVFHVVVSGSLLTQWTLVSLAEAFTSGTPMVLRGAFFCGVVIGFLFNYVGYHLFVWPRTSDMTIDHT